MRFVLSNVYFLLQEKASSISRKPLLSLSLIGHSLCTCKIMPTSLWVIFPPSHPMASICRIFLVLSSIYFVTSPACLCLCCHMFTLSTGKPQNQQILAQSGRQVLRSGPPLMGDWNTKWERSPLKEMLYTMSLGGNVTWILPCLPRRLFLFRSIWPRTLNMFSLQTLNFLLQS